MNPRSLRPLIFASLLLTASPAYAQVNPFNPPPTPPEQEPLRKYQDLRYTEDWTFLRPAVKQLAWWDPYKYIPLDPAGHAYLTLGGEIRERYELFNHPLLPPGDDRDGYLLQRFMLHLDLHLGPSIRIFGQLASGLADADEGTPRPTDVDRLDLHQLFADIRLPLPAGDADAFTLRLGRQEMAYGSGRFISTADWANVRHSFDAVRLLTQINDWHIDAFLARPVETDPGIFDDYGANHTNFWGLYATHPLASGATLDAYYLGLDRPNAQFSQGTGDELRHTLGARLSAPADPNQKPGGWDYDAEAAVQWGQFATGHILAYTAAADAGYTWADTPLTPRLALHTQLASGGGGDHNPQDATLTTFNPLFPKAGYFSPAALFGPSNLLDIGPSLRLKLPKRLTLTTAWDFFWRQSTADGLYDESGLPVNTVSNSTARFVGHQAAIGLVWEVPRHITIGIDYVHLFAGDYLRQTSPPGDIDYVGAWIRYRF